MQLLRVSLVFFFCICLVLPSSAIDPRQEGFLFTRSLYPPGGFSAKKSKAIPRADAKQPKAYPLIGKEGKFTDFAQWYYAIGSDPKCFEQWWLGYFNDSNIWKPGESPVFTGEFAGNQGHRIIAWLGVLKKMVDADAEIDPAVKAALLSESWKRSAEEIIGRTINADGMLEYGGHKADMACMFHFIRTKFGAIGLRLENIYTLDRSQHLIANLLTLPWMICDEDKWLAPPGGDYLEKLGKQKVSVSGDVRLVKDGKVLYSGGMFIGWKDKPALHGTWDGLSIINSLFKYHPDPDPQSRKSIFYLWNQLPHDKKQIAQKAIVLCSRRLWLDWQENKGPTWCWVRDGKPTDDDSKPSEAPSLPAYDGYGDNQFGWAKACWEEMFGSPMRNTSDGARALLAIAHGSVLKDLQTPVGQQVPGRYDYDAETQQRLLDEDLKKLGKTPAVLPGKDDEAPKLKPEDPKKGKVFD